MTRIHEIVTSARRKGIDLWTLSDDKGALWFSGPEDVLEDVQDRLCKNRSKILAYLKKEKAAKKRGEHGGTQ